MPQFTVASNPNIPNYSGSSGSIMVQVTDAIGGGDPVTKSVDIVVAIESELYSYSSGTPAESSTFGNNGVRWNGVTYTAPTSGAQTLVTYNWTRSNVVSSAFVVMVITGDGPFATLWGTTPGMSPISP